VSWHDGLPTVLDVLAGLLLVWSALIVALWITRPGKVQIRDNLRLPPDPLRPTPAG
jgi:hypothetical protein